MRDGDGLSARRAEAYIVVAFLVTVSAVAALVVVYWRGGQVQLEGALLAAALGAMAYALGRWARHFLPVGERVEERHRLASSSDERAALAEEYERGEHELTRRSLIVKAFVASLGALGLGALIPLRSFGPRPGNQLRRTGWRPGMRAVTEDGTPVTVDSLEVGGVLTVFPESREDPEASQVLLVRVADGELRARPGREGWAPSGYVAYSKLCTHVGCPVGLYNTQTRQLLCPCHQSLFDVLDGARPVFGPATRSLPQLPLDVSSEGFLVARSDFTEPVGPGFWER